MSDRPPVSEQITFLYTEDIEETAPFYEDALGLALTLDQGGCRIYQITGQTAYVGICERATPRTPDGVIFTLVTPDVDGWYGRIRSHGYTPEDKPKINKDYGIYHFFVKDPNGYLIEVQRFLDEDWNR
jgi:catechol 2,3-dioxygenase-like lactoylglutathione lyase family enzyme